MAEVKPFKGLLYSEHIPIEKVVAPPYDVINETLQEELYQRSPYNIVRITLGKIFEDDDEENNRYTRARAFLEKWQKEGILKENQERFYIYKQEFKVNNKNFVRYALVARVRLEEFEKGIIIPHEKTLSAPKKDRLRLMKATECNLSPVFGIVLEEGSIYETIKEIPSKKLFEFKDENEVIHKFYEVDPSQNREIERLFKDKKILIADGHHRYETALNYKKEMESKNPNHTGNEPYNYVLMAIVSSKDRGLVVLPIHRVIKNIPEEVSERAISMIERRFERIYHIKEPKSINSLLKKFGRRHFGIIYHKGEKGFIFRIEDESDLIDVQLLHERIIKQIFGITEKELEEKTKIDYYKNIEEALENIKQNKSRVIVSYNPPTVEEIADISLKRLKMPQKSTYFYPKFYSGLVIYKLK